MIEVNKKIKANIANKFIKQVLNKAIKYLKIKQLDISVALVSQSEIKKLNQSYRGQLKPTDVLSFNYDSSQGEIIICYDLVKQQAREYKHPIKQELARLLIHGLLHLAGYDHQNNKQALKMEKLEQHLINLCSISNV